jgi:hypothetical protein
VAATSDGRLRAPAPFVEPGTRAGGRFVRVPERAQVVGVARFPASSRTITGSWGRPDGLMRVRKRGRERFLRRAIVGERTAGAGRTAGFFPAELGLSVSLSTTRIFEESSGREWQGTGVLPDIVTMEYERDELCRRRGTTVHQ